MTEEQKELNRVLFTLDDISVKTDFYIKKFEVCNGYNIQLKHMGQGTEILFNELSNSKLKSSLNNLCFKLDQESGNYCLEFSTCFLSAEFFGSFLKQLILFYIDSNYYKTMQERIESRKKEEQDSKLINRIKRLFVI